MVELTEEEKAQLVGEVPGRRVVATGAVLLLICAAFVGRGIFGDGNAGNGGDDASPEDIARGRAPVAAVTYEITGRGSADISYLARSERPDGGARPAVEADVRLPWRKTVFVPAGERPVVSVRLGERGGQARCALAVGGKHRHRDAATGAFGRATCSAGVAGRAR
ncbi:hypothetical protein STRAU_1675 [Streptomyces aurantiacus JA 4570]|uniref:MmpS family membrane protein n=1 Tax=Streptomyces aurantiacus JA 4570 TaxID=1286094 RepID=S3ZP36_9ACTN|nr:hypothetical protein STRAU_1675 [Streptomyces aurantiacus JA 4570]